MLIEYYYVRVLVLTIRANEGAIFHFSISHTHIYEVVIVSGPLDCGQAEPLCVNVPCNYFLFWAFLDLYKVIDGIDDIAIHTCKINQWTRLHPKQLF